MVLMYVPDADAVYHQALRAGATSLQDPQICPMEEAEVSRTPGATCGIWPRPYTSRGPRDSGHAELVGAG
jgi:hypothetical protein